MPRVSRVLTVAGILATAMLGCADRAPPAAWPQPEPPSLARPLPPEGNEDADEPDAPTRPIADEPEPAPGGEGASEPDDRPGDPEAGPGSGTPASGA